MSRVLYGCVVVLTMLVGLGEDPLHPLQDMVMVWLSVVGVGLSEFWSEIAVQEAMLGHKAYWPEVSKALRHSLWVLPAALVPTVTFSMAVTGQLSFATGYKFATRAMVAFMFAATARTRWLAGANLFRSTVAGLVASVLGYGLSQLRAFVH